MAVRELLTDAGAEPLGLSVRAGEHGLDNLVTLPRIQKPGLALAGFVEYIHSGRIQILGKLFSFFLIDIAAANPFGARVFAGASAADAPDSPATHDGQTDWIFL